MTDDKTVASDNLLELLNDFLSEDMLQELLDIDSGSLLNEFILQELTTDAEQTTNYSDRYKTVQKTFLPKRFSDLSQSLGPSADPATFLDKISNQKLKQKYERIVVSQGALSNLSGSEFEKEVLKILVNKAGLVPVSYSQYAKAKEKFGNELVLLNVPYTSIYGRKGFTEFVIKSDTQNLDARIELKYKGSGGSTDERIPYMYLNMLTQMPEKTQVAVLEGSGLGVALNWAKQQPTNGKELLFLSYSEFLGWLDSRLVPVVTPEVQQEILRIVSAAKVNKAKAAKK